MKQDKIKKEIQKICTYHSDDGTSGYLLNDKQFNKIFNILDYVKNEERNRIISLIVDMERAEQTNKNLIREETLMEIVEEINK